MSIIRFTDRFIKNVTVLGERQDFRDEAFSGGDFGLRVTSSGRKTFFLRYVIGRKHRRFKLGTYPAMSLSGARRKALCLVNDTNDGADPQEEKKRSRKAETVNDLFDIYFTYKDGRISAETLKNFQGMHRREIKGTFGELKATSLRKTEVVPILESVASRAPTMSNRIRELILAVFNHSVSRGLLEFNPLSKIPKFGINPVGERYLSKTELRFYLDAVDSLPIVEQTYFRLLLYLGMRSGELSRLEWRFIDDDMLAIPSSHQKSKKPLRIPLVSQLHEVFELLRTATGTSKFMFPSPDETKPRQAFYKFHRRLIRLMGSEHFELRDIRRTAETHMRQIGCLGDIVSLLLGHNTSGLRRHYDKGEYLPQKKAMLSKWISWLELLGDEELKVVNLFS